MTKKDAEETLVLLKLARERVDKEIKAVLDQFCRLNDHDFRRKWRKFNDKFLSNSFVCILCDKERLVSKEEKLEVNRQSDIPKTDVVFY